MRYYLFSACMACLGAALGLFCHWLRGVVGQDEKPFGTGTLASWLQGSWLEQHIIGAEYTDTNAWDLYSLRNMAYMALAGAIVALLICFACRNQQTQVLGAVCRGFTNVGVTPVFCR